MTRSPKPLSGALADDIEEVQEVLKALREPVLVRHRFNGTLFSKRMKFKWMDVGEAQLTLQTEGISHRPVSDNINYEGFFAIPRTKAQLIAEMSINLFGCVNIILPYKTEAECNVSCHTAKSPIWECECYCLGEHHGKDLSLPKVLSLNIISRWPLNDDQSRGYAHVRFSSLKGGNVLLS